jgi:hypothetical protein
MYERKEQKVHSDDGRRISIRKNLLGGLPFRFWFLELCAIPRLLRDERVGRSSLFSHRRILGFALTDGVNCVREGSGGST